MYIFSWGYSSVSLLDILYLAMDSLLKHLCCYFLQFLWSVTSSFAACVQELHKNSIIRHEKISKASQMNFFGIGIVSYFLTWFKLTTCKSFSSYRPSQWPALTTYLDVHFFSRLPLDCSSLTTRWNLRLPLKFSG